MNELDELKQIIDENLEHIQVTNQLKRKTLKRIFKNENRFSVFMPRNWMKTATVFSIFVVLFTFSINAFINNNNPDQVTPTTYSQSITQCPTKSAPEFDAVSENEPTTDDECQMNP